MWVANATLNVNHGGHKTLRQWIDLRGTAGVDWVLEGNFHIFTIRRNDISWIIY